MYIALGVQFPPYPVGLPNETWGEEGGMFVQDLSFMLGGWQSVPRDGPAITIKSYEPEII